MNSTIQCQTLAELAEVCAALAREGIAFHAESRLLTVTITGY